MYNSVNAERTLRVKEERKKRSNQLANKEILDGAG